MPDTPVRATALALFYISACCTHAVSATPDFFWARNISVTALPAVSVASNPSRINGFELTPGGEFIQPGAQIPIVIDWPETYPKPVTAAVAFGIPFATEQLWDERKIGIFDENNRPVPAQIEVTARWSPEGSVRWIRVDTMAKRGQSLYAGLTEGHEPPPVETVQLSDSPTGWIVDVADWSYHLSTTASPIKKIYRGRDTVASTKDTRGLFVVDWNGRLARASSPMDVRIESAGPLAASIRFEGPYKTATGEELARHITRLEFFAGQPEVNITHTLILSRDTNEVGFKEIGWEFDVVPGVDAQAVFGISPVDPAQWESFEFDSTDDWLSMLQMDYPQFGGGQPHFEIRRANNRQGHGANVLHTGAEMADWGALRGSEGGLLILCRESARQHPKEISIGPNRMLLALFSSQTEEILDFRSAALLERWNRGGLVPKADREKILNAQTNAVGWSKTHQIAIRPISPEETNASLADTLARQTLRVFATIDPEWIYRSGVMGPLYPADPDNFPVVEDFIEAAVTGYIKQGHSRDQQYGFVDYFAGPHYQRPLGGLRFRTAYAVRMAPWLLYARSGDRTLREFAEGTNRKHGDSYHLHLSTNDRIAGLYAFAPDNQIYGRYPYYWGTQDSTYGGGGPNSLNQYLWDYYLTGYRRSGDIVSNYAEGIKQWWQPGRPSYYILKTLRNLVLAYSFEWDQELQPLIKDYLAQLYDPRSEVAIKPGALTGFSTRKTEEDTLGLLEVSELLDDSRLKEIASRLARYNWMQSLGDSPAASRFDKGGVGWHLWKDTKDPSIATELFRAIRQGTASAPDSGVSVQNFRQIGLPYALAVVAESAAIDQVPASWAGFHAYDSKAEIIVRKAENQRIRLFARGDNISLAALGATAESRLHHIWNQAGASIVTIPIDSGEGCYALRDADNASLYAVADDRVPMVVHAPGFWRPEPREQNSAIPVFFLLPEENKGTPRVFFEGPTRLYTPAGEPYKDGQELQGWIDLPPDQPGLWSFRADRFNYMRVQNLPPFFAFDDPGFYFVPEIDWQQPDSADVSYETPATSGFVPLGGSTEKLQAIYLSAGAELVLGRTGAGRHKSAQLPLPYESGTIEFWVKPYWNTFDLFPQGTREFLRVKTADGRDWHLSYSVDDDTRAWPEDGNWRSHVFDAEIWCASGRAVCLRRGIVHSNQWMHVALVWGAESRTDRWGKRDVFRVRLFINGIEGQHWSNFRNDPTPESPPTGLILGSGMAAAFRNLIISNEQKYTRDFQPPNLYLKPDADSSTVAIFPFDGSLKGFDRSGFNTEGWALTEQ